MNYRAEIAQMLRTMPSDWRRQYAVGKRTLERNTGMVIPDVPTPEQAMEIVRNTAGGKKDADQPLGNIPVPQDVRDEAMHGLRLSHRHNYGAWEFFGIARAIQLALSPAIPERSRQRMKRYLSDHAKDKFGKNFGKEDSPSRGYMAWLNWGGDAGAEWVEGTKRASYRSNPKTYLFSYGSNSPRQLAERLGHAVKGEGAYAPGMVRAFRGNSRTWGGGVGTLLCEQGGTTYGYITEVSDDDLDILDQYEGAPRVYKRTPVDVVTQSGRKVRAIAYIATSSVKTPPTRAYLNAVAETISQFWSGADGSSVTWRDITVR
jgi:cation transport regulator ChaC